MFGCRWRLAKQDIKRESAVEITVKIQHQYLILIQEADENKMRNRYPIRMIKLCDKR